MIDMSESECNKNLQVNVAIAAFKVILLGVFICLTVRVFKKVQWNDKYMLAMLLFLQLHLITTIITCSLNAALYSPETCNESDDLNLWINKWIELFNQTTFLAISLIINCRNWIFYYIKIGEMSF